MESWDRKVSIYSCINTAFSTLISFLMNLIQVETDFIQKEASDPDTHHESEGQMMAVYPGTDGM